MDISRRHFTGGSLAALVATALANPSNASAASTVSITACGGSTSIADNSTALRAAVNAAGSGGTVTIPNGYFAFTQPLTFADFPINIVGADRGASRLIWSGTYYGIDFTGNAQGSRVSTLSAYGPSSATFRALGPMTTPVRIQNCDLIEPNLFAVQSQNGAKLVVEQNTRFIDTARSEGSQAAWADTNSDLTIDGCSITGFDVGLYASGANNVEIKNSTVDAMWWHANPQMCAGVVKSATATSLTSTTAWPMSYAIDWTGANGQGAKIPTVTAWKSLTTAAKITPVSGKPGWFTVSGLAASSLEPRLMIRDNLNSGVVTEVNGSTVHVPNWYTFTSRYPRAMPTTTVTMTIERPYIARVRSMSGSTLTVDRWRAGGKNAAAETPPAGARVQVNQNMGYQVYSTNGTKNFKATNVQVFNSWTDSISAMYAVNMAVDSCTIWDGQDVGVTLQNCTGSTSVTKTTTYRQGTAAVFAGSPSAQVGDNTFRGSQWMADSDNSYGALQVEGGPWVNAWHNTFVSSGAPFENRAILIEGRYGIHGEDGNRWNEGPFSIGGHYNSNTYSGYPKYDVTIRGTKANVDKANTTWAAGTRFETTDGATLAMLGR